MRREQASPRMGDASPRLGAAPPCSPGALAKAAAPRGSSSESGADFCHLHQPSRHLSTTDSKTRPHPSPPTLQPPNPPTMPPLRPPTHLLKRTSLLFPPHPTRHVPRSARTLASTHPPDVSEHPSPDTASHESHYDPPSGWLFGVPPGEKYKNEGWENTWVYGFWGSLLFGVVAYAYKPDTS